MRVACDIETNGLVNPDTIWVITAVDLDSDKEWTFVRPDQNPSDFLSFATSVNLWVFHNGIQYDVPILNRLVGSFSLLNCADKSLDTLVLSRLFRYNVTGGHSLAAWGVRRGGRQKVEHEDWSQLSDHMIYRCLEDSKLTKEIFLGFEKHITRDEYRDAVWLEHDAAKTAQVMHENGFYFDIDNARVLHSIVANQVDELREELQRDFKPTPIVSREVCPKATKFGTINKQDFRWTDDLTPYEVGCAFTLFSYEEFNPGSPKQIVSRLNKAGWAPFEKTKGHLDFLKQRKKKDPERLLYFEEFGWKVNEANLGTLSDSAPLSAHRLRDYLVLSSRQSTLEEWITAYNPDTHRIHGKFTPIGAWTHRSSHSQPNMANIPRISFDKDGAVLGLTGGYGYEMRSLFLVTPGKFLVGVDAEGIQLRVLAHLMDDEIFTEALVSGDKSKGTDVHTLNMKTLGSVCLDRDVAKTFIYSWVLGASVSKTAVVLDSSRKEAEEARDNFLKAYPGLKKLKEKVIPKDAKRGYFIGLDKRLVPCDNEHLMLAGYLQNGEAVIMKLAKTIWAEQLDTMGVPYVLVNFVHDEWQTEANTMDDAEVIAMVQKDAIVEAGKRLNMKCALAGSSSIGQSWAETH